MAQLARNLAGLSGEEAMRTLRMCILSRGRADAGLLDDVLDAKRQALRSDGLIETVRRDTSFGDVAGLEAFARMDRETQKRLDAGRSAIWIGAAKGNIDYRRAGMREEPRRAGRRGRMGI